jgi:exodeoxyribonuclease VII small subunit
MSAQNADLGYGAAMTELEAILAELEGDDLDVDILAVRVQRASELLKVCRARIVRAQQDVDRIVAELDEFDGSDEDEDVDED